jgi:hypothetical protein
MIEIRENGLRCAMKCLIYIYVVDEYYDVFWGGCGDGYIKAKGNFMIRIVSSTSVSSKTKLLLTYGQPML